MRVAKDEKVAADHGAEIARLVKRKIDRACVARSMSGCAHLIAVEDQQFCLAFETAGEFFSRLAGDGRVAEIQNRERC